LQKTPKQFGLDHPAADLLKRKQWLLLTQFPASEVLSEKFPAEAVKGFQLLIPFISFLNAPLKELPARVLED